MGPGLDANVRDTEKNVFWLHLKHIAVQSEFWLRRHSATNSGKAKTSTEHGKVLEGDHCKDHRARDTLEAFYLQQRGPSPSFCRTARRTQCACLLTRRQHSTNPSAYTECHLVVSESCCSGSCGTRWIQLIVGSTCVSVAHQNGENVALTDLNNNKTSLARAVDCTSTNTNKPTISVCICTRNRLKLSPLMWSCLVENGVQLSAAVRVIEQRSRAMCFCGQCSDSGG